MKKFTIIACVIVLLVIIVTQVSATTKKATEKPYSEKTLVKKGNLENIVSASGKIQSNSVISLKFQTSGLLTYVGVKKGDIVKKGQLVASLDRRELEKNLKKKLNDYLTERWTFEEDKQETYKDQALSNTIQRALDKNQFALEKSVIDVEIVDIALKFSNLYSPIDGIITDVDSPLPGVNITPTSASFTVADFNDTVFSINIDEVDIGKIKIGDPVNIKLDAYENEIFKGVISEIGFSSTTTSSGSTAFPVEVKFPDNASLKFKIGMNGDAEIRTNTISNTLYLPPDYIFEDTKGKFVNTIDSNNKISKKYITIGVETNTATQILKGVKENETIVVPSASQ